MKPQYIIVALLAITISIISILASLTLLVFKHNTDLEAYIAKDEFGVSATQFSTSDSIYPTIVSPSSLDKPITVTLASASAAVVMERTYNILQGGNSYGDYNAGRNITPGQYIVEFRYDNILFKTIRITVG